MENIETKEKDTSAEMELASPSVEVEVEDTKKCEQDKLFTNIAVNQLTQNRDLANVLHKILTLCTLSKIVAPKILTWVQLVESITKQEFEELSKIQKNFDFQIVNRDFRNDEDLKRKYAIQEQANMTKKLTSLIDVPMIDEGLLKSQINLTDAEFGQLNSFFFPAKNIDIVAVA